MIAYIFTPRNLLSFDKTVEKQLVQFGFVFWVLMRLNRKRPRVLQSFIALKIIGVKAKRLFRFDLTSKAYVSSTTPEHAAMLDNA